MKMTEDKPQAEITDKQLAAYKEWMALLRDEWKTRRSREFILIITCAIILLYIYPLDITDGNLDKVREVIDISPLSIKIPLADAIAIFPTIIAAIYLVYLSSSSKVNAFSALAFSSIGINRSYSEDVIDRAVIVFIPASVTAADPDKPVPLSALGMVSQLITLLFVGLIFSAIPYAAMILSIYRGWQLFDNNYQLLWNLACFAIMLLAVVGQLFGSSKERGVFY